MRSVRFKFCCNIVISGKIIKEMPGLVASGTSCIICLYLNAFVRDCHSDTLLLQHDADYVNGSSLERECSYTVNKALMYKTCSIKMSKLL
jgi:hypothetical protein